jgi:pyruvate dehydrogenase E2 component (dihydrolipoamide acetyltransferase)
MGYVIRMPQMGMSMEEGTVVEWSVDEGESVATDDVLCVVESEKTTADVEAREAGVLRRIVVPEGGVVEPGTAIGILAGPDEDLAPYAEQIDDAALEAVAEDRTDEGGTATGDSPASAVDSDPDSGAGVGAKVRASPGARRAAEEADVDLAGIDGSGPQGVITEDDVREAAAGSDADTEETVRASPGARKRAEEAGISLGTVEGTGPDGVIAEADVERAIEAGAGTETASPVSGGAERTVIETRELSGMQRTIAERLGTSYREAVHVTLGREYDARTLREVTRAGKEAGVDVALTDLLVKALGETLGEFPAFNALFEDGEHRLIEEVNVGLAVDVEGGLVTPVLGDVRSKSAETVNRERDVLTERVRSGEFTMDDLEGGTFTVSNLGLFGVDHFDPVINPPQVAILGVGRVRDDGTMTLSLSFDHRVVNGADAARFLDALVDRLTDGATLRGFVDADVDAGVSDDETPRRVRVTIESGYAGTYYAAGTDVPFDEPESMGGGGTGPDPVEHLLGALGSCLSLSVRTMADRDGIQVDNIETTVEGTPEHGPLESVAVELGLATDAGDEDVERVVTKAERACYVARSLSDDLDVALSWSRQ